MTWYLKTIDFYGPCYENMLTKSFFLITFGCMNLNVTYYSVGYYKSMMHPWDSFYLMPLLEILKFWRVSPSLKYLWGGISPALDSRCKWLDWKPTPFTHVFTALKYKHGPFSIYGPKHKTRNCLHHLLVFLWTLFDLVYDNVLKKISYYILILYHA
jgi:hypothetical protein